MDVSTIILGKPEYSEEHKVNLTLAVTFASDVVPHDIILNLKTDSEYLPIECMGKLADGVDAYKPNTQPTTSRHLHFKLTGLNPGETYRYQLISRAGEAIEVLPALGEKDKRPLEEKHFQAPPLPGQQDVIQFAVAADQEIEDFIRRIKLDDWIAKKLDLGLDHGEITTEIYKHIAEVKPQVFIHLGDIFHDESLDHPVVKTLAEFEEGIEKDFDAVVRDRISEVVAARLEDDHDFGKNDSGAAYFRKHPQRLENATAAFTARWPVPTVEADQHRGYFYQLHYGDVTVWCLNNRVYNEAGQGLLGAIQTAWLKETLVESNAKVKIIATPLPFVAGKKPEDDYRGSSEEWDQLLKLFAEQNVTAIFAADSHNYSRTDLSIGLQDKVVTIPQYVVGTLGGVPQKMSKSEIARLPKPLLPEGVDELDFDGSEVKAYYTSLLHPSKNLLNHHKEQRAFKEGKWVGKEVKSGAFGSLDVTFDLAKGKMFTSLYLTKQAQKHPSAKPFFEDTAEYPLIPNSISRPSI
ncbi:MAG: alkaline phosphatase D family protein [Gammaproteobacteria bacterium]